MSWTVLFWNIQGTAKGNVKLAKVKEVVDLVKPDIIGFSEVGLKFPYDEFPAYTFQEQIIQDRNDHDTPKGLALGIKICNTLRFTADLAPMQTHLFTSSNMVSLTRPLLHAWVNDVEIILVHAPSTSGGPLGRSTVGNVADYLRDQCRQSRGTYKGFAMGDFNAVYSPYKVAIDEEYEESFPQLNLKKKTAFYYIIQLCDPGWDMTQKSGGVLDYIVTCGIFGIADKKHHHTISALNESQYLPTWYPSQQKTAVGSTSGSVPTLDASLDSAYGTVKGALDSDFTIHLGPRQTITGWHIDHRPVIYDIMNAERGPLAPRVIQSHINA